MRGRQHKLTFPCLLRAAASQPWAFGDCKSGNRAVPVMRRDKSNPQPGLDLSVLGGHKGNSLGRQAWCLLTFKEIHPMASCRDPGERWEQGRAARVCDALCRV